MPKPTISGLYALVDDSRVPLAACPAVACALAKGGVAFIQLRLKGLADGERLELHRGVAQALKGHQLTLCVNDRADLAAILQHEVSAGLKVALHLGQDDLPPSAARAIVGEDMLIGWSTHNVEQVLAASDEPVDYLGFGPIRATATKIGHEPPVGLLGLQEAVGKTTRPVVAIGGLDTALARDARRAGAHAVAMVGELYQGLDLETSSGIEALRVRAQAISKLVA